MGFNNPGAEALAGALAQWKQAGLWPAHPVGINLGKSKITPLAEAAQDYANSFRLLRPHADFFVVNVSSPNTPNLRQLQDKSALDEILAALQEIQQSPPSPAASNEQNAESKSESASRNRIRNPLPPIASNSQFAIRTPRPILVKVAPDLSFSALDEILELAGPRQIAGIVATNTTLTRPETSDQKCKTAYAAPGGLSGRPLRARSTEIVRHLYRQTRGALPDHRRGRHFQRRRRLGKNHRRRIPGANLHRPDLRRPRHQPRNRARPECRMAEHAFTTWPQAVGSAAKDREQ